MIFFPPSFVILVIGGFCGNLIMKKNLYLCYSGGTIGCFSGRYISQQAFLWLYQLQGCWEVESIWSMSSECHFGTWSHSLAEYAISGLLISQFFVQIKLEKRIFTVKLWSTFHFIIYLHFSFFKTLWQSTCAFTILTVFVYRLVVLSVFTLFHLQTFFIL